MPKANYKSIIKDFNETEKELYAIFSKVTIVTVKKPEVPTTTNFSDLHGRMGNKATWDGREGFESDLGDNGAAEEKMASNIQADALLLNLLCKLNDRQKIILLYQVLREAGYNLNHGDCAKTLSMTREHYMFLLKEVKQKSTKVLQEGQE